MLFSKSFLWVSFFSFLSVFIWFCSIKVFSLSSIFQPLTENQFLFLEMSMMLDKISLVFIFMVFTVTSLVLLFSEYYLDSYNNKKFFMLTLLFFSFMSLLSLSSDMFLFMLGWDGLGISSLFLIMFYPNKVTLFNSFITLFFNRLGDIFLIVFFCLVLDNSSLFYNLTFGLNSFLFLIMFLCLMTKSAQIPFSSWLPAAMSAPTPISAMVHSSTLVTAGVLMFFKFFWYLQYTNLYLLLVFLSISTFLVGGLLGCVEKDLKKVVAFSTMSQISMILLFISLSLPVLAMSHTFCHALFKTLLFCGCGLLFTWLFSDQNSKSFKSYWFHMGVMFLLILSVFSMSGLTFSSAFLTKDSILEYLLSDKNLILFFFLVLGSIFTLTYSSAIFKSMNSLMKSLVGISNIKFFLFKFFIYFSVLSVCCIKMWKELVGNNFSFVLFSSSVFFLTMILLVFSIWVFKISFSSLFNLSLSVFHMKESSFSSLSILWNSMIMESSRLDQMMFKPSSLFYLTKLNFKFEFFKFFLFCVLMLILISM